jgi:A/G-specific adenine glycosylase
VRLKRNVKEIGVFFHVYSHFKITVHAFRCEVISDRMTGSLKWVAINKLEEYPMGKIDRQIAGAIKLHRP